MKTRHWAPWVVACFAGVAAAPAMSYTSSYTYVKMSLAVPWTLYFIFLAGVLIPFVVMVVLAWRSFARPQHARRDATAAESTGTAP